MDRKWSRYSNRPATRASLKLTMKPMNAQIQLPHVSCKRRSNHGGTVASSNSNAASTSTSAADLASLFECPVCFEYVLPPILQCHSGHLVCQSCRPMLSCCPTCRGPLGNIRNLAMEKVASTVLFPCKFASSGCQLSFLHTEKIEHEEVCEFRPYLCPCPGALCKWEGSLEQVMPHLLMSHKSITTLQGEDIVFLATDINLPGAVDWVMMQSCFNNHFMLVLEKQEKIEGFQQFFAIVQLIGSRKEAENFAYRLELNGHKRRLTWEATPRSIHEGVSSAILNSDCLVFDTSMAKLFADNGNLGINVTVSMA
ncbi:E3 ubiquitin-protein ligase Siah1-like isoform X1 [Hetaerina americana]|uniref:E3 ubiquitin-protein ligase Siah1-like isoform X1 n=1 Tax=Hetaerina americana TaxID=62018 RepID=UPI003A7F1A87